jgi:hypothetical protein
MFLISFFKDSKIIHPIPFQGASMTKQPFLMTKVGFWGDESSFLIKIWGSFLT